MIPRIYIDETCPLEGYEGLTVHVLANATDREWQTWCESTLGMPDCPACADLRTPKAARGKQRDRAALVPDPPHVYCPACVQARARYGQSFVLFYGPTLLGEDVSTPEAALALLDRDDALPSEIVIWLQLVPGAVRARRTEALLGNLTGSVTTPTT